MKKMIVAALAAIVCGTASAQIVSSTSREISTTTAVKAPSTTRKYLQVGLGFLGMSGKYSDNLDSAIGFDFLYGYEKPLGDAGVWWGMEVGVGTSRGWKVSNGDYSRTFRTYSVRYMPANFGYRYAFDNGLSVEAHLGVGVSFDFAGGETEDYDGESETYSIWDIDDYMPLDVFMKLGAGVSYKYIGVDVSWQKGFVKYVKDGEWTSSNVFLNVRYNF